MTRAEAQKLLGDDWCAIHGREKEWPRVAAYFDDIPKECPNCVMEHERLRAEARRILRTEASA